MLRHTKTLRMVGLVAQAIMRRRDRDSLLDEICRVATQEVFCMAWIGMLDHDRHWLVPMAQAGIDDAGLGSARVSACDDPDGHGPTGTAVRTGSVAVCNDALRDPRMAPWRQQAELVGFRSCAAAPLRCNGQVIGALTVCARTLDFFDAEESNLLGEVASDISFALESLGHEAQHRLLEERIVKINNGLLSLGADPQENIAQLTRLCGEILNATGALYTRLENGRLVTTGRWHTHEDMPGASNPIGHMCYDLASSGSDDPLVIRNLQDSPYAESAPCVRNYGLRTYLGKTVAFLGVRTGVLCVMYARDWEPAGIDLQVVSILASAIGIEELRRTAVAALQRERDRSQQYLDTAGVGILALDAEGCVTLINRKGCELLGWTEQELLGREWASICVPPEAREDVRTTFRQLMEGRMEIAQYHENEIMTKSGTRKPFAFFNSIVRDSAGTIVGTLSSGEDLTERRRMELEREELHAQLAQSRKMEAIGTLAGGIAHDFYNILTTISGHAELALGNLRPTNPAYGDINQILDAAGHAATLTRQLLLFSRRQPTLPVPLDPNAIVQSVLRMLIRIIGEHIHVETALAPGVSAICADPSSLEQVIMNIAVNARDAMPSGGTLTIATSNVTITPDACHGRTDARPGEHVRITVSDTGTGIPADVMPRIFEPFFTTKEPGKGTGLGLAAVYGIVAQHHGWIDVATAPGRGSTFSIHLPAHQDTTAATAGLAEGIVNDLRGNGERVLIVEDDPSVRAYAARVLRRNGYVVVEAGSGREALEAFVHSPFEFVFSDVILPDANGFVLAEDLSERAPGIKVILTSGYTDRIGDTSEHRRSRGYLHKPYSAIDLLKALKDAAAEATPGTEPPKEGESRRN